MQQVIQNELCEPKYNLLWTDRCIVFIACLLNESSPLPAGRWIVLVSTRGNKPHLTGLFIYYKAIQIVHVAFDAAISKAINIAFNIRHTNFKLSSFRDCIDIMINGIRPALFFRLTFEGYQGKWDSVDIYILWIKLPRFRIRHIAHPSKAAANYLLTKKLTVKGAHAKDMGDVICIPPFS